MHKNCIKVALKSWPARREGSGRTTTGNGHSKMPIKIISRPQCPAGRIVYAQSGWLGDSTVLANGRAMITMCVCVCVCLNMSSTCRLGPTMNSTRAFRDPAIGLATHSTSLPATTPSPSLSLPLGASLSVSLASTYANNLHARLGAVLSGQQLAQ